MYVNANITNMATQNIKYKKYINVWQKGTKNATEITIKVPFCFNVK